MNALNALPADPAGILAAMLLPTPAANVPTAPAFFNIINLLLSPELAPPAKLAGKNARKVVDTTLGDTTFDTSCTLLNNTGTRGGGSPRVGGQIQPKLIADALIRLMLASAPAAAAAGALPANLAVLPKNMVPAKSSVGDHKDALGKLDAAATALLAPIAPLPAPASPIATSPVAAAQGATEHPTIATSAQPAPLAPDTKVSARAAAPNSDLAFSATLTPKTSSAATSDSTADPRQQGNAANDAAPVVAQSKSKTSVHSGDEEPAPPASLAQSLPAQTLNSIATLAPLAAASALKAPEAPPRIEIATALRTTEPVVAIAPAPRVEAAQEIAVRIERPQMPPVDLRIAERGGQIHVAVHTPDGPLQTSLRQDVGSLVDSLDRAGYHAETFAPIAASMHSGSSQMGNRDSQPDTQPDSSGHGSSDSGASRQQQSQQRQRDPRSQKFNYEMESAE